MAVAVQKREGETNEKLIGRWKKKTQQARLVQETKNTKNFSRPINKAKQKKIAVVREKHRAERKRQQFYS